MIGFESDDRCVEKAVRSELITYSKALEEASRTATQESSAMTPELTSSFPGRLPKRLFNQYGAIIGGEREAQRTAIAGVRCRV